MQCQHMLRLSKILVGNSDGRLGRLIFSQQERCKHSSTQVKRIFKNKPARIRVLGREGKLKQASIPKARFEAILEPDILTNGWCALPGPDVNIPKYPFQVARTNNKPNDTVGFLPVYSEFRKDGARVTTRIKKVSGDRESFISELRAVLQIPVPKNPKDDTIRIRTGGTIEIKGNRVKEVKHWLASLGL